MCLVVMRAVELIKAALEDKQRWARKCSFIRGRKGRSLNKGLNGDDSDPMGSWGVEHSK